MQPKLRIPLNEVNGDSVSRRILKVADFVTCVWCRLWAEVLDICLAYMQFTHTHTHSHLMALFLGEPVPVCISLETDNHASTPPLKFYTGRMPFLPPNQQHQSTEGYTQFTRTILDRDGFAIQRSRVPFLATPVIGNTLWRECLQNW